MGILWFILRLLGWLARALKRVCYKIFHAPWLGYGANEGHGMKRKSGKRKNSKRSFKPLEISFSWFKVVFLRER
ncbi:hypothetical protein HPSH112_00110 [Helicobacter pylori Shi112]|nr:hypothetical protein HPSH112_00110 [Helicobacter pylori Shi112]